jgi:hypothetical protein
MLEFFEDSGSRLKIAKKTKQKAIDHMLRVY